MMRSLRRRIRIPRLSRAAIALAALALALVAGAAPACSRRATGIFVEIPADVVAAAGGAELTLKVRVRALEPGGPGFRPAGDVSPVLNRLPEQTVSLCADGTESCAEQLADRTGRHGLSFSFEPPAGSPFDGIPVVVHFALFAAPIADVADAFAALDDPALAGVPCGTLDCGHLPLAALAAVGAASVTIDRFGHDDADVVLYPLVFLATGLDVDPDGDTIPGDAAFPDGACAAPLADPAAPWNAGRRDACASIADPAHADCTDGDIARNPFELETGVAAGNRCDDGVDQDCDGADGPCGDGDGDGYTAPEDCNDADATIHPGAPEDATTNCSDGIDQDCQGGDFPCGCDLDGDGYCPTAVGGLPGGDCCEAGSGPGCGAGVAPADINPAAPELCGDGIDESCDGVDPPCASPDADGDGHCDAAYDCGIDCTLATTAGRPICCLMRDYVEPAQLAACTALDDCADWDAGIHPGHAETCGDGIDQDCDGDPGACPPGDGDGDGFPGGADCDDGNAAVSPAAAEICGNGVDDDCAGGDVPCGAADADGDGYVVCPIGASVGCDCCDAPGDAGCGGGLAPADIHPGAAELCNGTDDDCDGDVNDGNPGGSAVPGGADDCFSNPPGAGAPFGGPPAPGDESWRCRVGRTACAPSGSLVCIELVEPATRAAGDCTGDTLCNARNDVCLACPDGGALPPAERDTDGDGCLAGCGTAADINGIYVTAGDACSGQDCCDDGSEPACAGPAASMHPGALETCADLGADNDCDGDAGEVCTIGPFPEACDGIDQDCDCQSDFSDPDAQASCTVPGAYCDGFDCAPGCDGDLDCTNGNSCNTGLNQCSCGGGAPCTGSYGCSGGACLCGGSACGPGESCVSGGECACGGTVAVTGEACAAAANPDCVGGTYCGCGAGALCDADETCDAGLGQCRCAGVLGAGGPACPEAAPNPGCGASGCQCDGDSVCDADESCVGGSCVCGSTAPGSGAACDDAGQTPVCTGSGCACDADSVCGAGEACVGGACYCGAAYALSGEACVDGGLTPVCTGSGCACDADSLCDADEVCFGGQCYCGGVTVAAGPACPDGGLAPVCNGSSCVCDADSTCVAPETCAAGQCTCGASSQPAGSACTAPFVCDGSACVDTCPTLACTAGWGCSAGECACDDAGDCGGGAAECAGGFCDCDGAAGTLPACGPGATCVSNACVCVNATCF